MLCIANVPPVQKPNFPTEVLPINKSSTVQCELGSPGVAMHTEQTPGFGVEINGQCAAAPVPGVPLCVPLCA